MGRSQSIHGKGHATRGRCSRHSEGGSDAPGTARESTFPKDERFPWLTKGQNRLGTSHRARHPSQESAAGFTCAQTPARP